MMQKSNNTQILPNMAEIQNNLNRLTNTVPEVRGAYYDGAEFPIDGYRFISCRFDNCVLYVNSENYEFIDCVIDETTRLEFKPSLKKIFKLFFIKFPHLLHLLPADITATKIGKKVIILEQDQYADYFRNPNNPRY